MIVLTVIIIVACFVLGSKRTAQFESSILTAIGTNGNGTTSATVGANRQNSLANGTLCHGLLGTPIHHGTPLNGPTDSEPRYGTVTNSSTTAYDHYGFTSVGGVDTFHLSVMGDGGRGKELLAANAASIELNNCTYATAMKKRPQLNGTLCNQTQQQQQQQSQQQQSVTTCLDSKLIHVSEGTNTTTGNGSKLDCTTTTTTMSNNQQQQQQQQQSQQQESSNYFQTPYALSRLPRPCGATSNTTMTTNSVDNMTDGQFDSQMVPIMNGTCMNGCATLRPNHLRGGLNGDHVYDMPFPPKWV